MENELELPPDVLIRLSLVHQEYLVKQIEGLNRLVALHESELAIMWCTIAVLGGSIIWQDFQRDKVKK